MMKSRRRTMQQPPGCNTAVRWNCILVILILAAVATNELVRADDNKGDEIGDSEDDGGGEEVVTLDCINEIFDILGSEFLTKDDGDERTYNLCPGTYRIWDRLEPNSIDEPPPDGFQSPLLIFRSNVHVMCGPLGRSTSGCIFEGGNFQSLVLQPSQVGLKDSEGRLSNIRLSGITFSKARATNIVITTEAEFTVDDCIFVDNTDSVIVSDLETPFITNLPTMSPTISPAPTRSPAPTISAPPTIIAPVVGSLSMSFLSMEISSMDLKFSASMPIAVSNAPTTSSAPSQFSSASPSPTPQESDPRMESQEPSSFPSDATPNSSTSPSSPLTVSTVPTATSSPSFSPTSVSLSTRGTGIPSSPTTEQRFITGGLPKVDKDDDHIGLTRKRRAMRLRRELQETGIVLNIFSSDFQDNELSGIGSRVGALINIIGTPDSRVVVTVANCLFERNTYDGSGQALISVSNGDLTLNRNCFTENAVARGILGVSSGNAELTGTNYGASNEVGDSTCDGAVLETEECLPFASDVCLGGRDPTDAPTVSPAPTIRTTISLAPTGIPTAPIKVLNVTNSDEGGGDGLGSGIIAGIVVGVVIAVAIVAFIVVRVLRG